MWKVSNNNNNNHNIISLPIVGKLDKRLRQICWFHIFKARDAAFSYVSLNYHSE